MKLKKNFHIHSQHSCDSACAKILDIIKEMEEMGFEEYGLTDHLHTSYNLPDIISARRDFLASRPPKHFHFGIEVSVMDQREIDRVAAGDYHAWGDEPVYGFRDMTDYTGKFAIDLDEQTIREQGIEFVVGGIHWPLSNSHDRQELIRHYFDLMMFLVDHPLVSVLAHPWDSLELAVGDWYRFRDKEHIDKTVFADIPQEYNDRLAAELARQNKPAEINLAVTLKQKPELQTWYMELFRNWKRQGVKFTMGYDLHAAHFSKEKIETLERLLTEHGFTESDFVLPFRHD